MIATDVQRAAVCLLDAAAKLQVAIETPLVIADAENKPLDVIRAEVADHRDLIATRNDVRAGLWAEFREAYLIP